MGNGHLTLGMLSKLVELGVALGGSDAVVAIAEDVFGSFGSGFCIYKAVCESQHNFYGSFLCSTVLVIKMCGAGADRVYWQPIGTIDECQGT